MALAVAPANISGMKMKSKVCEEGSPPGEGEWVRLALSAGLGRISEIPSGLRKWWEVGPGSLGRS